MAASFSTSTPSSFLWGTSQITNPSGGGGGGGATYAGRTQSTGTAGEALVVGNVLRFDNTGGTGGPSAGQMFRSDGSTISLADVVGIALSAATTGNTLTYATSGEAGVLFAAAPATLDNGKTVYLSTGSVGMATLVAPTSGSLVRIGYLTGANGVTTTPTIVLSVQLLAAFS